MNREIKFRAWDSLHDKWLLGYEYPNLGGFSMKGEVMTFGEYQNMLNSFKLEDWDKIILMQYTGLKDKNGKEIYEGDVLKCKVLIAEEKYTSEAYYSVNKMNYEGFSISVRKMTSYEPSNQYPIHQELSFKYRSLCIDYRNQKFDQLAFEETHGSNHMSGHSWIQNHYSNDVEVVGNIYENPNLLQL